MAGPLDTHMGVFYVPSWASLFGKQVRTCCCSKEVVLLAAVTSVRYARLRDQHISM